MTNPSEFRPDVVPVHPTSTPNPGPKGILVLKSWILAQSACHLMPPFDFKTTPHRTSRPFLHPTPRNSSSTFTWKAQPDVFTLTPVNCTLQDIFVYIPVYFPQRLGCHDLKSIWSDLHPRSSRIQPTSSLCALVDERTAVSSTSCAPCCDFGGAKTRFYPLSGSTPPEQMHLWAVSATAACLDWVAFPVTCTCLKSRMRTFSIQICRSSVSGSASRFLFFPRWCLGDFHAAN